MSLGVQDTVLILAALAFVAVAGVVCLITFLRPPAPRRAAAPPPAPAPAAFVTELRTPGEDDPFAAMNDLVKRFKREEAAKRLAKGQLAREIEDLARDLGGAVTPPK